MSAVLLVASLLAVGAVVTSVLGWGTDRRALAVSMLALAVAGGVHRLDGATTASAFYAIAALATGYVLVQTARGTPLEP